MPPPPKLLQLPPQPPLEMWRPPPPLSPPPKLPQLPPQPPQLCLYRHRRPSSRCRLGPRLCCGVPHRRCSRRLRFFSPHSFACFAAAANSPVAASAHACAVASPAAVVAAAQAPSAAASAPSALLVSPPPPKLQLLHRPPLVLWRAPPPLSPPPKLPPSAPPQVPQLCLFHHRRPRACCRLNPCLCCGVPRRRCRRRPSSLSPHSFACITSNEFIVLHTIKQQRFTSARSKRALNTRTQTQKRAQLATHLERAEQRRTRKEQQHTRGKRPFL